MNRTPLAVSTMILLGMLLFSPAAGRANSLPASAAAESDLISWWRGDDGASDSIGSNEGTMVGGDTSAPGVDGGAFLLDEEGDHIVIPHSESINFSESESMSVALWVYRTGTREFMHILGKRAGCESSGMQYQMAISPNGLGFGSDGGGVPEVSGAVPPLNAWTHLAVTFDGATFVLYVNGVEQGTGDGMLGPVADADFRIGTSGTCPGTWPGRIDDVRLYSRALTEHEVLALYEIDFDQTQWLPGFRFGALGSMDTDLDLDLVLSEPHPLSADPDVWRNESAAFSIAIEDQYAHQHVHEVALGDLDGDGDLDAYLARGGCNYVMVNDGQGALTLGWHQLSDCRSSWRVALGDIDDDHDLDAFVLNSGGHWSRIWLNDGLGSFSPSIRDLPHYLGEDVALGDLDGDGDLDAFIENSMNDKANTVWLWIEGGEEDEGGYYEDSGQSLGSSMSYGVELGDVDGDGDLDAFVANYLCEGNKVWLNDGSGTFADSGQSLGASTTHNAALGDVDNDGDLDAIVANRNDFTCASGTSGDPRDKIWVNNGLGVFHFTGQYLSSTKTHDVLLGDLDGDGDLDAVSLWEGTEGSYIWINRMPTNRPPVVDAGGPYQGVEGAPINLSGEGVSDPDQDPLTYSWTMQTVGSPCIIDMPYSENPSVTCGDNGDFTVSLTVSDGIAVATDSTHVAIDNVAPEIDAITVPLEPIRVDAQANHIVDVQFGDPAGAFDTPYTCSFDLDGDTVIDAQDADGITECRTSLSYVEPGVYTVTVTVEDKDGGQDVQQASDFVVIYDPEGGFVTGGGWIWSETGWCNLDTVCAGSAGKARFGFVSKYRRGASTPVGQTEFNFTAGDLNFRSESYEWLVVAGARAIYKGVGTINGEGSYGFMLSAIDEKLTPSTEVDLFRIKIWAMDDADRVVYDNQPEEAENADPDTAIGGGSIVIHTGN
jgi:hypothetical protein